MSQPKRHHERGAYRSIFTVLLDGKDFRALDDRTRWVFVALKLTLGPYQIGVLDAPEHILAAKTGCTLAVVRRALVTLIATGWVRRETNVLWVVEGLRFEPSLNPNNEKNRIGAQNFLETLPRLQIVADFRLHYRAFFPDGHGRASDGPTVGPGVGPPKGLGSREEGGEKRETEEGGEKRDLGEGPTPPDPLTSVAGFAEVAAQLGTDGVAVLTGYCRSSKLAVGVVANVRALHERDGFAWDVIDRALIEFAAGNDRLSPTGLRAFCTNIRQRTGKPSTSGPLAPASRRERESHESLSNWVADKEAAAAAVVPRG